MLVVPPGYDARHGYSQARPTCFGDGQFQIPDRSGSDRLCSTCMNLGHLESTLWDSINNLHEIIVKHHRSVSALIESGRGGCHLCGLLLVAWQEKCRLDQELTGRWVGKRPGKSAALYGDITLKFERVEVTIPITKVKVDQVQITILCGDLLPSMGGQLICTPMEANLQALPETCLPTSNDTNTGSSASLSRIKAWLDICTFSHPVCSQADCQPPPLPTRVVAVGQKESSRCYLVSGKEKKGHYATLSHCWGDSNHRPLLTTDQTLACRQQGIEDEELPKTFRHAVQVCREIGIEYLWIDSLCIIQEQESQEDWAKEAPKMGHVYGNSRLTICAAAAADSTQGSFEERHGLFFWPCPVVMFGQACYVFRYPTFEESNFGEPGDFARRNPLFRRAWVLQEQALSRRSIIFSKDQLVWRCPTLSTNEKYPLGIPHMPSIFTDKLRLLHCIINGMTSLIQKSLDVDIYICWYRIVGDFTSRSLTYNEDRLPAIAGIAQRFGMIANDSYHAGLWRRDMIRGLLWSVSDTMEMVIRSATAPSWSWASVNWRVYYHGIPDDRSNMHHIQLSPLIDILDILDPTTCRDHPFGATSKASLRLSGILLQVVKDRHSNSGPALAGKGTYFRSDIQDLDFDVWDPDRSTETALVCLPVRVYQNNDWAGDGHIECLILQPVEGEQNTYSRIGLCHFSGSKGRNKIERVKIAEIIRMAFEERGPLMIV